MSVLKELALTFGFMFFLGVALYGLWLTLATTISMFIKTQYLCDMCGKTVREDKASFKVSRIWLPQRPRCRCDACQEIWLKNNGYYATSVVGTASKWIEVYNRAESQDHCVKG